MFLMDILQGKTILEVSFICSKYVSYNPMLMLLWNLDETMWSEHLKLVQNQLAAAGMFINGEIIGSCDEVLDIETAKYCWNWITEILKVSVLTFNWIHDYQKI